jgi:hypothetical protein
MHKELEKKVIQIYIKNKIFKYMENNIQNNIGISLGNLCMSATWAVINGYREKKQDGYNTCVFDLMISNYNGIVKCILEDFNNFVDPNYLTIENECIINTYYNFLFNHEGPGHAELYIKENWPEGKMHFVNNNYAHFIERYLTRINNFRNYLLDTNNYIYFIFQFVHDTNTNDDFYELRKAISLKYPDLKYEIIVIQ